MKNIKQQINRCNSRLGNLQYAIQDRTREAVEEIRGCLKLTGSIYAIENDGKYYYALYENKGAESGASLISNIEIDIDDKLRVGMTNGLNLYEEELSAKHVIDIITIIREGHGSRELKKQLPDAGIPYYEGLISRQFRRRNPEGSFTRGYSYWEDMAEKGDWGFVCQFLPDYERRDDVMASDDLACVIDGEKPLDWLYENYPQWDGLTIEEIKKVRAQWDYELFQEAEGYLAAAIQSGEIEVREFPVSTVSARIEGEGDSDRVWLQCANQTLSACGTEFHVPSCHLQNVKSRWINEGRDEEQFQIYFECRNSGDAYWCNAQSIDFE